MSATIKEVLPSDWRAIADLVWQGKTIPQAVQLLGLERRTVESEMILPIRRYLVEVSLLANCRQEFLGEHDDQMACPALFPDDCPLWRTERSAG